MLKKIILNRRTLPVPVPLKNLEEALLWIEDTLQKDDQIITKIKVDGVDLIEKNVDPARYKTYQLGATSKLEIQLDSPAELSLQSLDTIRNLVTLVERGLKGYAVACWQTSPASLPPDIDAIHDDLDLIEDLTEHFLELADMDVMALRNFEEYRNRYKKINQALDMARSNSDWKGYARILLNQLEPLMGDIILETGNLQAIIFAKKSESSLNP